MFCNNFYGGHDVNGLVQACSNSIANAMVILQSCFKPSIYVIHLKELMIDILHFWFAM